MSALHMRGALKAARPMALHSSQKGRGEEKKEVEAEEEEEVEHEQEEEEEESKEVEVQAPPKPVGRPNLAIRTGGAVAQAKAGGARKALPGGKAAKKPAASAVTGKRPAKSSQASGGGDDKKKRKKKRKETFNTHLFRVLKQIHPETGISKRGMSVLNSFVLDVFHRLASEASVCCTAIAHHTTLSSRDMQTATRLVIPGELSKHAVSEATKALEKYAYSKDQPKFGKGAKR